MSEQSRDDPYEESAPVVRLFPFEAGMLPERMSKEAVGLDVKARAIVSAFSMDPELIHLRETIFDFHKLPKSASDQEKVELVESPNSPGRSEWAWRLDPGDRALVGIGAAMSFPEPRPGHIWFAMLVPRSGLAAKFGVIMGNPPGILDSDYRGEGGVALVNTGYKPFYITKAARIAQIIPFEVPKVSFGVVANYEDLGETDRGAGGFGSTEGYHITSSVTLLEDFQLSADNTDYEASDVLRIS